MRSDDFEAGCGEGETRGSCTSFKNYELANDPLRCLRRNPIPLAETPTRLQRMPLEQHDELVNWGYAVRDAELRAHIDPALQAKLDVKITAPTNFPFPSGY